MKNVSTNPITLIIATLNDNIPWSIPITIGDSFIIATMPIINDRVANTVLIKPLENP